ncbi:MAG: hypothetical protein JWP48_2398 [Actinoallomurus sp.]|jgi:uncharacterized protein (DUF885 family)|nr:hypothetical protein [Actinoallomurus sp.]
MTDTTAKRTTSQGAGTRPTMTPDTTAARLHELGERYFATEHTYDPYNATLLGLTEFDHLPGDPSEEASARAADTFAQIAREVARLDPAGLDADQHVDLAILTSLLRGAQQDAEHSLWAANASAKSYVSRQGLVFQAVPAMTVTDAASAERYLARLDGIAGSFEALGERYAVEAARGRVPTATGVGLSIAQLDGYLALDPTQDVLLKPLRAGAGRADDSAHGSPAIDPSVMQRALRIVTHQIRPAMAALADRLRTELLPVARPDNRVGVCFIPGGPEGYAAAVTRHTTTSLSPEEIHQIGLDVLADMRDEWSDAGRRALGKTDFALIAERMRADPALRFETSAQIVQVARAALDRAEAVRLTYFPDYALPECVIEEINPIDAQNTALAYYRPPAVDGSRPGAHCLLVSDPGERFRFEYEALAFHESVPGHHLQLSAAQTLQIPRYRQHLDVEACSFNEGWGLYSEHFADEIGLYSDDLCRLGMLSFRAIRACRLVIDTGIHHFGWSRQQAIDFMWSHTATTASHVRTEVDRYIAWPGQALAYMIGRREILRLRAESQAALGSRFSIVDFHETVLGSGAVPLTVLADNVARWRAGIEQQEV